MKEYRPYLRSLQRQLPLWLLLSFVAGGATWAALSRVPPTYSVHFSYVVSLAEREVKPEYTFDGFYALQATDLFTTTLAGWLKTPELIVAAYHEAGLPLPAETARKLRRSVEATKAAPQLVEVTVSGEEQAAAERLAAGVRTVLERNVARYQAVGTPALTFTIVATEPWTGTLRHNAAAVALAVLAVTLLLLINLQLVWESVGRAGRD